LAVLCAILTDIWFFGRHRMPPTFDDAWYLENSLHFYWTLKKHGFLAFMAAYENSFRFKAPLISVLPLPFYFLFGPGLKQALWVNIGAMAFLGIYLYRLARSIYNARTAFLSVLIAMTVPMLFGLSRRLLVEYSLAACVTAAVYHLLRSEGLRRESHVRALGALLGLGLLLKVLFPFYLLGPLGALFLQRRKELGPNFLKDLERPLKTLLYIAAAISLTWYANNLVYVAGYFFKASFGDIASHYGSTNVFSPIVLGRYWMMLANDGVSPYYALTALLCLPLLSREFKQNAGTRSIALWFFLPLAVSSFGVNKDIRFFTPCIPAFSLLLARGLDMAAGSSRLSSLALAVFFFFPLEQFSQQSFGKGLLPELRSGPLRVLVRETSYSFPPQSKGEWNQDGLVDWLARSLPSPSVVAIGSEHGHLNANNLAYFSALKNLPVSFVSYGYAEERIERTVLRLQEKNANALLLVDGLPEAQIDESVLKLDSQIRSMVKAKRLPYRKTGTFKLTDTITASLYVRYAPIRL